MPDCLIGYLPTSKLTMVMVLYFDWYWTYICTTMKACLFWACCCCCCCCLIARLLGWVNAWLLHFLITLPLNWPWWRWFILIGIGPTYVQLRKHVCFGLVVVVVVVVIIVTWLPDCLTDWLPCCLVYWLPYLQIDHVDGGLFWLKLDLHIYNYESRFVFSLLMLLLLLLDCLVAMFYSLIAWLIDCQITWLIDHPTSKLTKVIVVYFHWYWTNICTTVKACLFWTYCCCCCCLIPWLLDWLIARLPDWLITLPPNSPWWWWFILICIGPTYVQMWKHVCFELVVVVIVVTWLPDCLNEWLSDCLIGWSPYLPIDHDDGGLFWFVLDLHMYNCEIMFVLSFFFLLLLLLYCLIAWLIDCQIAWLVDHPTSQFTMVMVVYSDLYWAYICTTVKACLFWACCCCCCCLIAWLLSCLTDWLPDCLIGWSPYLQIHHGDGGLSWFVLGLHMYKCESMLVLSLLLLLLLLLLDCLTAWMSDCQIAWLVDHPTSQLTMVMVVYFDLYWTYICTTVQSCLFGASSCSCCCCLIAWLLDWLIARLLDWLINLPPNSPWWWWYILICIGPTYVQLWKHVCFELVVVVLVAWLPDCLNEWLPDCLIGWSP